MKNPVSVACIIIGKTSDTKNKILIAHRIQKGDMGGRWEFPGGKVDSEETDHDAVVREMLEEFGENVLVGDMVGKAEFSHGEKKCSLHAYEVFFSNDGLEKPFSLSEHTEYAWVDSEKIPVDNFVDSDLKIYPLVKKYVQEKYLNK